MTDAKIPTEALEGLMRKVFVDKNVQSGLFWDAALKSSLYIPLAKEAGDAVSGDVHEGFTETPIQLGKDGKGRNILWLFTSPDVMLEYTEHEFQHIELSGRDMFERIKNTEFEVVLIGPNGLTLNLDPKLIKSLSDGVVPQAPEEEVKNIPKDSKVKVGKVVDDTTALEERFVSVFSDLPEVEEAAFMQIEDDNGPRLLLGLKMEDESRDNLRRVAGHVAQAAEGILAPGKVMDVTLISGSLKDAFNKWGRTFYTK